MASELARTLRRIHWETYVWLIYSVPYLIASFDVRLSGVECAAMLLGYAVFLVAYFASQLMRGPRVMWMMVVMNVLMLAFSERNPGAGSFLVYGAAMSAHAFDTRGAVIALGVQTLVGIGIIAVLNVPSWYYVMPLIGILIGAVTIQGVRTEAGNRKLRLAQAEVERLAKLNERERIARDLHDVLGHTLSVIVLKAQLAQKLIARDTERATVELADVERIARESLAEVRQAITGYRSSGLTAELDHVRATLAAAGIHATVEATAVALSEDQENALSLALREATTNVIRHAAATSCHIRLVTENGSLLLAVEDNGRGGDAPFGNGLTGMRERIQALGGVLSRDSHGGTRLQIRMPL